MPAGAALTDSVVVITSSAPVILNFVSWSQADGAARASVAVPERTANTDEMNSTEAKPVSRTMCSSSWKRSRDYIAGGGL